MRATFRLAAAIAVAALAHSASAQQLELPRPSPNAKVSQFIGVTEVSVDYSSPGVKGRKIWGGVVPYDKVWRAGANSADQDHLRQGRHHRRQAGRRRLVRVLRASRRRPRWTLILNKDPKQRGHLRLQEGRRRAARRGQAAAGADARAARLLVLQLQRRRRHARSRVGEGARVVADQGRDRRAGGGQHQGAGERRLAPVGAARRATSSTKKHYDERHGARRHVDLAQGDVAQRLRQGAAPRRRAATTRRRCRWPRRPRSSAAKRARTSS